MKKIELDKSINLTINDGYAEFKKHCQLRNYSPYTILHYGNTIHVFELFYSSSNAIETIDQKLIEDYISYLFTRQLSGKTVATYIASLRTILYFFMEREYISTFKISKPRYDKPIKEVYSDSELRKLLVKPNIKSCSFSEYRNWVLVNYLIATGQRRNTIMNLKIGDLDIENGLVGLRVVKNRKPTIVPLAPSIIDILVEYLRHRKGSQDNYLFCNDKGTKMSESCFGSAIRTYNKSKGIQRTSIHAFRHTYAKKYLLNGGNVFMLQRLMMHSDLKTTQEYLNLYTEDLQKDYKLYNPLDQLINSHPKG